MNTIAESHLSNVDPAPTGPERRTWGTYHLAALWIGLSIVIARRRGGGVMTSARPSRPASG
jgi:nucleobase:cation symporter-1, NCS1 family